jgi:hypothetical protein
MELSGGRSKMLDSRYGFRIVGALHGERRLVDWSTAFHAYAACDPKAKLESEAYLSAFTFGDAFKQHLETTGSTKDYHGDCFASWLWFDIDRADVSDALADARKLTSSIVERYGCNEPLIFFSGSKGFHIGLPTSLWNPEPSGRFNKYAKAYAVFLASLAGVTIDESVYDKVRAFRAPNSRHQKTGCYKRFLTMDELLGLRVDRIIELAKMPEPFEMPTSQSESYDCWEDWRAACGSVDALAESATAKRMNNDLRTSLNRSTLAFIRESADVGDRHPALFKAAANLAEFDCSFPLAWALLAESALDSGLSPSDVRRQIECGLNHKGVSP